MAERDGLKIKDGCTGAKYINLSERDARHFIFGFCFVVDLFLTLCLMLSTRNSHLYESMNDHGLLCHYVLNIRLMSADMIIRQVPVPTTRTDLQNKSTNDVRK